MRALLGLTVPLLLLTVAFTTSVPTGVAQETTYHTISGRVVSDTGDPIEGATVHAYSYSQRAEPYADDAREAKAVTDADGAFSLELPAGRGYVNVYYEKWRQGDGRDVIVEDDLTLEFTLTTPPPKDAVIEGRVVDANGAPIEGAQVSLQYACCYAMPAVDEPEARPAATSDGEGSSASSGAEPTTAPSRIMPPHYDDHATATTGADGAFRFEAYAGPRQVSAWAKGYAQTTVDTEAISGETRTVEIVLEKVPAADATIAGRIVDASTGLPLANAQVSLRSLEWGRYGYEQTGSDGSFRLTTIPGWVEISVHHWPRYDEPMPLADDGGADVAASMVVRPTAPQYYPSIQILKIASGENALPIELEPKPRPSVALIGYVVDPDAQTGVAGARVSVWSHDNGDWGEAVTDATGSFRLMVRPGHYSANAYKDGYLGGSQTIVVRDEPTQRADLLLPKGTQKWAPCYEEDASCGPTLYHDAAYAEEAKAEGAATTAPAPAPAPAMSPSASSATLDASTSRSADDGGADRARAASFEGSGGGLPTYDPDDAGTIPASAREGAAIEVPFGGALLAALALAIVALAAARRRG